MARRERILNPTQSQTRTRRGVAEYVNGFPSRQSFSMRFGLLLGTVTGLLGRVGRLFASAGSVGLTALGSMIAVSAVI